MTKEETTREIALHRMLEKATVRIEILLGRARACDAGDRTSDGHALSLLEGEGWIEEQRDLLLSAAIGGAGQALSMALDALIWASGSEDFGPGGKVHAGWVKLGRPAIKAAIDALGLAPACAEGEGRACGAKESK